MNEPSILDDIYVAPTDFGELAAHYAPLKPQYVSWCSETLMYHVNELVNELQSLSNSWLRLGSRFQKH